MSQYNWGHSRRYNDYASYIKKQFGARVQKISVNVGFGCPNRDGTKGTGGCIYCDNNTFKPGYCEPQELVSGQIEKGISFFEKKYPDMRFMAYFQSYTNTYAPLNRLKHLYYQAINNPKVVALIIGTRPDCIDAPIIDLLAQINQKVPVTVEFGIESTIDKTLQTINRCHTFADTVNAIQLCHNAGLQTGGHLILGLPGETYDQMLNHAKIVSQLPLTTLKLHQLQVIKNTKLEQLHNNNNSYVRLFSCNDYVDLVINFIERLSPKIVIERFVSVSPVEKLVAPVWERVKNFEFVAMVEKELERRNTYQGRLFSNVKA